MARSVRHIGIQATPDSNEPVEMVSMWLRMFVKHTALEGFMSDVWVQDDPRGMD